MGDSLSAPPVGRPAYDGLSDGRECVFDQVLKNRIKYGKIHAFSCTDTVSKRNTEWGGIPRESVTVKQSWN